MRVETFLAIIEIQWIFAEKSYETFKEAIYPLTDGTQATEIIDQFQHYAGQKLNEVPQVATVFDFEGRIFPDEFATGVFTLCTFLLSDLGMPDPSPEVDVAIRPIGKNCEQLTPDLIMKANMATMAKYLLIHNVLNCTNVKQLATASVISYGKVTSQYVSKKNLRSKLPALPLGFFGFLIEEKLFDSKNVTQMSAIMRFYANEYNILSKEQKGKGQPVTTNYPPPMVFQHPCLNPSDSVCRLDSGPIAQFIKSFEDAVTNSSILAEIFNVSNFNPLDIYRDTFYSSVYFLQTLHAEDVPPLADFMAHFIRNIKVLPPNAMAKHRSHFMAKYLWSENFLHTSNAQLLSKKYAQTMENLAGFVMNLSYPKSKLTVLSLSIKEFLLQTQTFQPKHAIKLAFYYGNEWRCQLLFP